MTQGDGTMMSPNKWHGNWKIILRSTVVAAMLMVVSSWNGMAADEIGKPVLRIPKMAKPPIIDGKINEEEWAGAGAVTGLGSIGRDDQYPTDMRATWYLGYDDTNIYLAMHLPIPKGVTLNAQSKNPEDCDNENAILFGDHVEIQITPHTAQRAMQTGFGFYKFIVNPFDVYSDWWHNCDRPGDESGWSSGAKVKSTFDQGNWWLEMAIPIVGTMKSPDGGMIKKTDGLELIMQLVNTGSCGGYSYASWVPGGWWLAWDLFYKVILDPQSPVMQFTDTGDLINGKLDTQVRLRGAAGQTASVALDVLDVDGKSVFKDTKNLTLNPTDWSVAAFQQPTLAVPKWNEGQEKPRKRNRMLMRVESDGKTIYTADLPFVKHTSEWTKKTYGEYVGFLPKGDYKTKIAYIPRNGKFRVTVDTDVLGNIPHAVRDAEEFRLRIVSEKGGKDVLDKKLPIIKGVGSHLLELGPLEGAYDVTIDLFDGKGGVVSTRKHKFARVKHEWENNTIGEERAVIPPFRPIEFAGDTLKTRWSEFKLGQGGLWNSVTAFGFPILTAPMRIEGSVDGKEIKWQSIAPDIRKGKGRAFPSDFDQYAFMKRDCPKIPFDKLPETDGYEATITGKGSIGPVAVTVNSTLEYDGYTRFRITYAPAAGAPVKVDRLEVVLDLFGGVNSLGVGRETIPHTFSLPAGQQGLLWESVSYKTRQPAFWGTFVPLLHLGDGKYGLQFRAASDEGWLLDDKVSCMRVERQGDMVRLRLLLVNAPATLTKARTVEFALLPLPTKPAPSGSRHFVWGGPDRDYAHKAYGWRKYGTGGDNWYLPSDEEFVQLGKMPGPHQSSPDKPTMRYSSFVGIGGPLPDCDSFRGQWFKDSEVVFKGAIQYNGKGVSPTGHKLDQPECFTEFHAYGWDEDLRDNYMWFHRKLVALSQSNGVYWDNGEIAHSLNLDAGEYGHVRDDGHAQPSNDSDSKRKLLKRLYTMGWLEGKPPLYNSKFAWQTPFEDIYYEWEGPWYLYTDDGTFFDGFQDLAGMRLFRSSVNTPATINAGIPAQNRRAFDYAAQRSYFALAILHDMGLGSVSLKNSPLLQKIDAELGFLDKQNQAEFIPYWETDKLVSFVEWKSEVGGKDSWREWKPENVFVSVFRSKTQPGKVLLWFVNAGDKTAVTGLRLDTQTLTRLARKDVIVRNLETGDQLTKALPPTVTNPVDKETLWGSLTIPPKDFRAVIVEKGEYKLVNNPWP